MNIKRLAIPLILLILGISLITYKVAQEPQYFLYTLPNLPAPIGQEKVLITSAGQSPEGYVMQRIARNLHIDADYRPRALSTDLYDYKTIVMVVGYSSNGLKETGRTLPNETDRVQKMLNEVKRRRLPLILVHLSGSSRLDSNTMDFLKMTAPYTSYFIGLKSADYNGNLRKMAQESHYPITLVNSIQDINIPFNSVFR